MMKQERHEQKIKIQESVFLVVKIENAFRNEK